MADLTHTRASPSSKTISGIIFVEIGMLFFVGQDAVMKMMMQRDFSLWMLISTRGMVALLVLTPLILYLGKPHRLLSPLVGLHFIRASLFAVGFTLFYAAFPFMGLAEVTTIFFAAPLFTALFAVFFLGETIGIRRIICLLIGFTGVVIAVNPGAGTFQWIAILPLLCAVCYALSQVIARQVGERETTLTMGLYTIALSSAVMLAIGYFGDLFFVMDAEFRHLRWTWYWPAWSDLKILLLLGCVGTVGYLALTRAYQIANASLIAPFDYTYLPFATLLAYAVWEEVPGWNTLVGMVLIIGSGLYLGYREIIQSRREVEPSPTAEVVFVPGHPGGGLIHASDTHETYDPPEAQEEEPYQQHF